MQPHRACCTLGPGHKARDDTHTPAAPRITCPPKNIKAPLCGFNAPRGRAIRLKFGDLNFLERVRLVTRRLREALHLVLQFQLFTFKAGDLGVINTGACDCSFNLFVEVPVLFCKFS